MAGRWVRRGWPRDGRRLLTSVTRSLVSRQRQNALAGLGVVGSRYFEPELNAGVGGCIKHAAIAKLLEREAQFLLLRIAVTDGECGVFRLDQCRGFAVPTHA